jgi:hypothetical protein
LEFSILLATYEMEYCLHVFSVSLIHLWVGFQEVSLDAKVTEAFFL